MNKFTLTLKLFCKTGSVIVPYILMMLAVNVMLYRLTDSFATAAKDPEILSDAMFFYGDINVGCFVIYLFFLFISYEYMRKVRESQMEEILSAYGRSGMGIYVRQFFVLALAVVLTTANISIYAVWGWKNLVCADELLGEVVSLLVVNVFLLSLAAVSMGIVLSRVKNRFIGYAAIVAVLFLILPNAVSFYVTMQNEYHIPVFLIRDLVYLIPPDLLSYPDSLYGFPLENYRIAGMLLWIVIASAILLWNVLKKQVRLRNVFTVCLCLLAGGLIYATECKGSVLLMQGHPEAAIEEMAGYYNTHEGKSEEAAFTVSKYALDLTFGKELGVDAWMFFDDGSYLDEYQFTLSHAYWVESVTDQDGNPLDYIRDGDYICILSGGKKLTQIGIRYRGHSSLYYANEKACFLPGFFAYYPKAGYRQQDFRDGSWDYDEPEVLFEVKVDRDGMTSNVSKDGSGFRGKAETLTLVDGFYHVSQQGEFQILSYPLMESEDEASREYPERLVDELEKVEKYLEISGTDIHFELPKKVIMMPASLAFTSLAKGIFLYEDHAVLSHANSDAYFVLEQNVAKKSAPEKQALREAFFSIRPDEKTETDELWRYADMDGFDGYGTEVEEVYDLCVERMKEIGVQNASRQIVRYLLDGNDHTDPVFFLKLMGNEVK